MTRREASTWLLLFATIATAVCAGIVAAALLLATTVSASREAERADLPHLPGRMTTEPSLPSPDSSRLRERPEPVALRTAVPIAAVRTPSPSAAVPSRPTATTHRVAGLASTYGPGWDGWMALPQGPGHRVEVCGAGGCVVRTSNDAGPSLTMQRHPYHRVVDLDVATFEAVCGVPWTRGLCRVTVTWREP